MAALRGATVALPLLLTLTTVPLGAQHYRWDLSANGGWGITSGALKGEDVRPLNGDFDVDGTSLGFNNNWLYGAQLGYWFSRSVGLRLNTSYQGTSFDQGDATELFSDVNIWGGTGDLLIRLLKPRSNWEGAEWLPFIALGAGANWVNPAGDNWLVADELELEEEDGFAELELEGKSGVPIVCRLAVCAGPSTPGFPGIGGIPQPNTRTYFLREGSTFSGLAGLGLDLRVAPSFAFRFETGFRFWKAPIDEVEQQENVEAVMRPLDTGIGSTISQYYATVGLNVLMGLRPKPIPIAAAPAPPPAPIPQPRPEPTTEPIVVCMVDPVLQGARQIDALRYIATGDTTIMRNGVETKLSDAAALIPVATTADWFVRGAPFEVGALPQRLTYLPTGSAQNLSPLDLKMIGTVRGLPVFIDNDDSVSALDNLTPNSDLTLLVGENAEVFKALDGIRTVYVPLAAVGCSFQALQKQEEVRKGK